MEAIEQEDTQLLDDSHANAQSAGLRLMSVLSSNGEIVSLLMRLMSVFNGLDTSVLKVLTDECFKLLPVLMSIVNTLHSPPTRLATEQIDAPLDVKHAEIVLLCTETVNHEPSYTYKYVDVDEEDSYKFHSSIRLTDEHTRDILASEHDVLQVVDGADRVTTRSYPRGPLGSQVVLTTPLCIRENGDGKKYTEVVVRLVPRNSTGSVSASSINILVPQ